MPSLRLPSTAGRLVDLGALGPGRAVIYCYPRTGRPGEPLPDGWDAIPGARGCTPQTCAFRDHHLELAGLGAEVYGLSTQPTEYQREMAERLHLSFEVLSDQRCALVDALGLADRARILPRIPAGRERPRGDRLAGARPDLTRRRAPATALASVAATPGGSIRDFAKANILEMTRSSGSFGFRAQRFAPRPARVAINSASTRARCCLLASGRQFLGSYSLNTDKLGGGRSKGKA
jgi:peroxiredoxin